MYPKLVDQIAGGIAKAVQKATDSHAFHEFPDCLSLTHTDRLSIKLMNDALIVRNEEQKKTTIMLAQVQKGHGLLLKNETGKSVMLVRLSNHTTDSLGKLMHPSQATLFKLMRDPCGLNFSLVKASSEETVIMRVEKVMVSLQSFGKAMGFLGSDCVYWLKSPDRQTVIGHIRTKLAINSNILAVKFMSSQRDVQKRAAVVGVALLLILSEMYPQLRTLLASD
uniref:Uncharacterized protein n=1 Tax=Globodera rostochiensis TaxID=31243 RepID=A0A914H7P2_GLORO